MEITTTLQGGVPILQPHGKVVGAGIPTLREKLALWIDDTNTSSVLIDFTEVRKIDSSALGMLVNMHVLAKDHDTQIGLINVGEHIRNLLVLSRLIKVFQCFQTVDAALEAFISPQKWKHAVFRQP